MSTEIFLCADCPGEKFTQEEWVEHQNRHAEEDEVIEQFFDEETLVSWLEDYMGYE